MTYRAIPAGKWRRYVDWHNLIDPFKVVAAFFYSLWLVARYEPAVVVSAGSFVSVPVVWAAWWCNIPVVIHQQDLLVGMAAKLMRPAASTLTKAFPEINWPAETIGNPVRQLLVNTHQLALDSTVPTVLIFGGGTGAEAINRLVEAKLCAVANVIHLTGQGKAGLDWSQPTAATFKQYRQRYHVFELLDVAMAEALQRADVVVCRAGLGTLSELAVLRKPTIVIPIPHSHQERNAHYFADHAALLLLDQTQLTPAQLTQAITRLLHDAAQQQALAAAIAKLNPATAAARLANCLVHYDISQSTSI
jgi:UDP-N-acetylglucosamine--N-acetylmuramyl-(pentapeptide) pyrophosphoryl-undecaprenol N-acetylglucosamine transferase